jgi:hypothetical protein
MRTVIAVSIVVLAGLAVPAAAGASTEPPASEPPASVSADLSTLVDRGVGAPRTVGALGTGTAAAFVEIDGETLVYQTGIEDNPTAFHSSITATGPDTFDLTLSSDVLTCAGGNVGSYRFALSSESTTLSLIPLGDACAERALAISGNWWHTACWLEDRDCLGPVEAGTYATNRFNPYGGFTFGEASFTLPSGWAVCYDSQYHLRLQPVPDCSDEDGFGIWLWADVAAPLQDCSFLPDPDAALGATNIADYLEALPTLSIERTDTVVSGLPAVQLDLDVVDGASGLCEGAYVLTTTSRDNATDPDAYGPGDFQHMRLILVDVLPDRTVAIYLEDAGQDRFDELATVAMPVIASFVFSATPSTIPGS